MSTSLKSTGWLLQNVELLSDFIAKNRFISKGNSDESPPYVVFDFDETCTIFDSENALYIWLIDHLALPWTPANISELLHTSPAGMFSDIYDDSIENLISDLCQDWQYLYTNFIKGHEFLMIDPTTLNKARKTPYFIDFKVKLLFLLDYYNTHLPKGIIDPYHLNLYYGFTDEKLRELAFLAFKQLTKKISFNDEYRVKKWSSPIELAGKSGTVTIYKKDQLAIPEAKKELISLLQANGIVVYIITASFQTIVQILGSKRTFGLNVPMENIFGMRLAQDKGQKILNQKPENYPWVIGEGKTEVIKRFIAPKHGFLGPILVAGDGNGDVDMMTAFTNTQINLIFNRRVSSNMSSLIKGEWKRFNNAKLVLQGQDEKTGELLPKSNSSLIF